MRAERGGRLGFNAKFIIEMGEESGSKGLAELVAAHKTDFAADVLVASDGPRVRPERPTLTLGCRGAINFDLVCDLREGGHHSGNWGGLIANPALILANALASIVSPTGALLVPALKAPVMSSAVKEALADVEIDGGEDGPAVDPWWGEPGHTPAERVYGSNVFHVLAFTAGTPGRPVNAVPPKAVANCQLRFIAGTDADAVMPTLQRHLDDRGFARVKVMPPPAANDGRFAATRTEPDHPWAAFVAGSLQQSANIKPAIVPADGRLDLQRRVHGHPGDPHDLDSALLRLVLAARTRRARADAALPFSGRGDGRALLGYRRGQCACANSRVNVHTRQKARRDVRNPFRHGRARHGHPLRCSRDWMPATGVNRCGHDGVWSCRRKVRCGFRNTLSVMAVLVTAIHCAVHSLRTGRAVRNASTHPHLLRQILPLRIDELDGADLPGTRPALDRILSPNGVGDKRELLEINEATHVVATCESGGRTFFVLMHAGAEAARHTGVEGAVLAARQNVDVSALGHGARNGEVVLQQFLCPQL